MSSISEVVIVNITKDTVGQKRRGFSTPLILGTALVSGTVATFVDKEGVADACGGTSSEEYKVAEMLFGQNPRVEKVIVGKATVGDASAGLTAIASINDSWYGLVPTIDFDADSEDIAGYSENNEKMFFCGTDEATIVDSSEANDVTSLAYKFKTLKYERTVLCYSGDAGKYLNAGICGRVLALDEGSYTAKFKTVKGAVADELSSTESYNARSKNCNTYEEIGGRNIFREGITPSGEFADTIIFVDWLQARMSEDVYSVLAKNDKVGFSDKGIATISTAMETSLAEGVEREGISEFAYNDDEDQIGGYVIYTPTKSETDQTDRQNRYLKGVKFTAWLEGAIHKVKIDGTVTV